MGPLHRFIALLLTLSLTAPLATVQAVDGTRFGDGNLPPGCTTQSVQVPSDLGTIPSFLDDCYHMRTGLNGLDTPIIDVLLVTPVSPYAERDLRAMRQVVEMWAAGIDYLAPQLGLDWLDAVEFNIFTDDDKITTHPLWDPEIVIVTANPVLAGVQGIGIDPVSTFFAQPPIKAPCRGANPLATLDAWKALPGFDGHHGHSGTYVEQCEGGGTVCYAVNLAIDPAPGFTDAVLDINTFDLVAHELGHCLTVGHVGDAGDHTADAVPYDDIMSYALTHRGGKCVSSLDVEAFALTMSKFLLPTPLVANHKSGPRGSFQVQNPRDHFYASFSGDAADCPKPDLGLVPLGEPVDFTPSGGVTRAPPRLAITSHADGASVAAGVIDLAGTVAYGTDPATDRDGDHILDVDDNCPDAQNAGQRDADGDGVGDACDDTYFGLPQPDGKIQGGLTMFGTVNSRLAHAELIAIGTGLAGDPRPKFLGGEGVRFNSRFSSAPEGLVTVGTTQFTWHIWDSAGTVVGTVPCTTVADTSATTGPSGFDCPGTTTLPREPGVYFASAKLDGNSTWITDTPGDDPERPGLKGFEILPVALVPTSLGANAYAVTFEDDGSPANTFYTEDSTLGFMAGGKEKFTLTLTSVSDVRLNLEWSSLSDRDDLDLRVDGDAKGVSARRNVHNETVFLRDAFGTLEITVDPWLVLDPLLGATYTLVATITPKGPPPPDTDGDGVLDPRDACPGTPAGDAVDENGCTIVPPPPPQPERVEVRVDGVLVATVLVDGRGSASWTAPVDLSGHNGAVTVQAAWFDDDWLVSERTLTLHVA